MQKEKVLLIYKNCLAVYKNIFIYRGNVMNNKEIKEESKDRKIRRHEVSFSAIQGGQSQDYLDGYLNKHSSQGSVDIVDQMVDKIDKKILRESLSFLDQISPNKTSSFNSANFGAKSERLSLPAVCFTIL